MNKYSFLLSKKQILFFSTIICFVLSISILTFSFASLSYFITLNNHNSSVEVHAKSGSLMLNDTYDAEDSRITDFFNGKESLEILTQTYDELQKLNTNKYYEIGTQDITFIGEYMGDISCVDGDRSYLNQMVDNEIITPLKSLQVGDIYYNESPIKKNITNNGFKSSDFNNSQDIIPVILGENYKSIFNLNDQFNGYYLGIKQLKFEVIGFFKPDTIIQLNGKKINLSDYVVTPTLGYSASDSDEYVKRLLSVKCEGYFFYNDDSEYKSIINTIKRLSSKTGFKYEIPRVKLENNHPLKWTYTKTLVFTIGSLLSFIFAIVLAYKYRVTFPRPHYSKKLSIVINGIVATLICGIPFAMLYLLVSDFHSEFKRISLFILLFALIIFRIFMRNANFDKRISN